MLLSHAQLSGPLGEILTTVYASTRSPVVKEKSGGFPLLLHQLLYWKKKSCVATHGLSPTWLWWQCVSQGWQAWIWFFEWTPWWLDVLKPSSLLWKMAFVFPMFLKSMISVFGYTQLSVSQWEQQAFLKTFQCFIDVWSPLAPPCIHWIQRT